MMFLTENALELRAAPRHPVAVPVAAHLLEHDLALAARDISRGGLYVESPHAPPIGHALHVSLHLEGPQPLEAIATVVRTEPGRGFAVRLSVPGREGRRRWQRFVASLDAGHPHEAHPPLPRELDPYEVFDFAWVNDGDDELG
jgi:hypothetical protein